MSGQLWYTKEQVLKWHEAYQDMRLTSRSISKQFEVKHETMLNSFRRLGLKLRPSGFRPNNCRGKDGKDNLRLRRLWFFNFLYKRRAARKGLEVTITDQQFIELVTSNCHYCNKDWKLETRTCNGRNVQMLTVDRKDSSLGYTPHNCVSCCKRCNTIKMDMSYDEFIKQIKAIAQHLNLHG